MNNVFKNVKCLMLIISCGLMSVYTVKASHQPDSPEYWHSSVEEPSLKDMIKEMIKKRIKLLENLMSKENGYFLWNMVKRVYGQDSLDEKKLQIITALNMAMLNHQYFLNLLSQRQFPEAVLPKILEILKANEYFKIFYEKVEKLTTDNLKSLPINAMEGILDQIDELKIEAYKINAIFTNKIDDEWKGNKAFPYQLVLWFMQEIFDQHLADKLRFNQNFDILRKKAILLGKEGQGSNATAEDFEDLLAFFTAALIKKQSLPWGTQLTESDANSLLSSIFHSRTP